MYFGESRMGPFEVRHEARLDPAPPTTGFERAGGERSQRAKGAASENG
jgi:hypothetical protein